ncbi:MAG: aminotransferase class I/II-fold pyridoxal phosphate-dependent enzyme, partial [Myxococcales bacterium]
ERLAAFERTEAALLFNSGYNANLGVLTSVVGEGDVILSDALNHASVVDGCRLSRAKSLVYRHLDLDHLRALLKESGSARRRLIVTDSVFSMDGDVAPLADIVALAREHDAMLMVDEAHATGVFGERGTGVAEAQGVEREIDFRVGTLGKSLGSFGAWVSGSTLVRAWLLNRARSLIFTTALPPELCGAAYAAVELVERESWRRGFLWQLVHRFTRGLKEAGFDAAPRSQIFPIVLGAPDRAMEWAARLREQGLLAKAIRPPTVPEGTSRIRFSLCAGHTEEQIDRAVAALRGLKR